MNLRISDDERLITLTKSAYEKINDELKELRGFKTSKTLKFIHSIEFIPQCTRYSNGYTYNDCLSGYKLDRTYKFDVPYEQVGESEQYASLFFRIKQLQEEANRVNDNAFNVITEKLNELNKLLKDSRIELDKNKQEIETIQNSVPKFFKWLHKIRNRKSNNEVV